MYSTAKMVKVFGMARGKNNFFSNPTPLKA
nr:MAG TPA: hypothetical protein [Caudoviricetes sp.]